MFNVDFYVPTRVVFGNGRLDELGEMKLPGKKALICITSDGIMEKMGILDRVQKLLAKNGVQYEVYNKIMPNPTKKGVMDAKEMALKTGCDFVIGLGGGSSIDTAKACAMMMKHDGDLWDYASVGTGKQKEVTGAAPVVVISTTAGTGTETDPYCVITNEETDEKIDFAQDALFPVVSIIDPELTMSLPKHLTIYQGFDGLFHALECYIVNQNSNRMVDVCANESVSTVAKWLPTVVEDGSNKEARTNIMYAADILSGFTQAMICTTSHHIIGQCLGGYFPEVAHGASLIVVAEEYYKKIKEFVPQALEDIGVMMGEAPVAGDKGQNFINALTGLMDKTGVRNISMSEYGIKKEDLAKVADMVVDVVGIDFDIYDLSKQDVLAIMEKSYR